MCANTKHGKAKFVLILSSEIILTVGLVSCPGCRLYVSIYVLWKVVLQRATGSLSTHTISHPSNRTHPGLPSTFKRCIPPPFRPPLITYYLNTFTAPHLVSLPPVSFLLVILFLSSIPFMPFCSFASEFPWCSQGFLAGPWDPHRTPNFLSFLILCASPADHGSELLPLLSSLPCLCSHSISTGLAPSFGTTQSSSMTVQACLLYKDSPKALPVVLLLVSHLKQWKPLTHT